MPHPRSSEDLNQSHGSPELFPSSATRFHSPGSVRHKFFRENHENQLPSSDRFPGYGPSPRSPREGFGARFETCDPQSPISDRSPDHFTRHARFLNSPDTRRERTDEHNYASTPERNRNFVGTIDFDGLRGVPVGPRGGTGKIDAKKFESNVNSPCIWIPAERVPPLPNLIRHLKQMLRAQQPERINVNEHGWHLFFDTSSNGQLKLEACYHEFHRKRFFSYELDMQCFPDGIGTSNQLKKRARTSLEGNGITGEPSDPPLSAKSSPSKTTHFAGREITYLDPLRKSEATPSKKLPQKENDSALKDTPSRVVQQDLPRHLSAELNAQAASPINANIHVLSQRSERDETGSQASGVTHSDSSRIKRDKCHVCSGETGHGLSSLVQCSTCRRKYHRRCHQDPVIPDVLDEDHSWSCRSCVKKGRTHKGKLQVKHVKPRSNPGPILSASSPQPALLDTDVGQQHDRSDAPAPPVVESQALSGAQVNLAQPGLKKAQWVPKRHVTTNPDPEVVLDIGNGDPMLSDPDDLVEKSFSAAAAVPQTNAQCQKPGKFKMTRTKLPPSARASKAQQEQPPNQVASSKDLDNVQAGSKHHLKDSSTNVPAVRNSVADLRALAYRAHESHQSAIKNGAGNDGNAENEERHSRDIRPESTTQLSSIEQPTVQSEAHQVFEPAQSDDVASVAHTRVAQLEIPESPDEVRLGSLSRDEATQDPRLLAKHVRVNSELSGLSDEQISNASPVQPGKHAASKKSKAPTFSCCSACQKRIPAGPSGMTRLCFGCKKKAAAPNVSQTVDAGTDTDPAVRLVDAVVPSTAEQWVAPRKNQEHAGSVTPNDSGGKKGQAIIASQLHGSVDQAVSAPPSATQAQPKSVPKINSVPDSIVEDQDEDVSLEPAVPSGKIATTPLAEPPHMPAPSVDSPSEHRSPTHDAADDTAETTSSRVEYIRSIVGDSHNRPTGSRTILVAMAMSTRPTQRMQAKDIVDWISANIPTCKANEGNWRERVVSQLTQGTQTKSVRGQWHMDEWKEGDGGVPGKKWYKLLPDKIDEMWTWCPLLQQPVPPKCPSILKTSSLKRQRESKSTDSATALRGTLSMGSVSSISTPTTPLTATNSADGLGSSKQGSTTTAMTPGQDAMDVAESSNIHDLRMEDEQSSESVTTRGKGPRATPAIDQPSSDDEPLLKRLRRDELAKPALPKHMQQQHTPANTEMDELPDAGDENAHVEAIEGSLDLGNSPEAPTPLIGSKKAKVVILNMRKGSLSDDINNLSSRNLSVTSFYDEWPEYREENMFDAQAKLAEIIKRPTRKQMFGKPAFCSRLRVRDPAMEVPVVPVTASPEKRTKMLIDPNNPYPWEDSDVDPVLEEYQSLDEFFDFPANMIPIISEGQLAYRDGTRNDDGRLPRAREVFKP